MADEKEPSNITMTGISYFCPEIIITQSNLINKNLPNKTIYSSFGSVEATNFKNAILDKIHWAAFEAAEV